MHQLAAAHAGASGCSCRFAAVSLGGFGENVYLCSAACITHDTRFIENHYPLHVNVGDFFRNFASVFNKFSNMGCSTKSLYKSVEALGPQKQKETESQKKERLQRERRERRKAKMTKWRTRIKKAVFFVLRSAITALVAVIIGWLMRRLGVF